jgi:hypothetical protein
MKPIIRKGIKFITVDIDSNFLEEKYLSLLSCNNS